MADERRQTYPGIPATVWWELRRRFQRSMPAQVTPSYLQTVLGVQEGHARNLIPMLTSIGLIAHDDGRPTTLANEWRTDEGYRDACMKMLESIYPAELRDAVPPEEADRQAAKRWFMRGTGVGEGAATRMASFYTLLSEGDSHGEHAPRTRMPTANAVPSIPQHRKQPIPRASRSTGRAPTDQRNGSATAATDSDARPHGGPSVHIDVQIHIPSDANGDQIDAIFASMAKHLYRR